jgi:predicted small metal-binding protein
MKTMTCKDMGGMCDHAMSANTAEEMMSKGMAHLEEAHPEMAANIKAMPEDHPMMIKWNTKFMADWTALAEDVA